MTKYERMQQQRAARFTPRYDPERQIYRNCPFCKGRGCLACPGEAAKAYTATKPQLMLTMTNEEFADPENKSLLKAIMSPEALLATKEEGRRLAQEQLDTNPSARIARTLSGLTHEEFLDNLATGIAGDLTNIKLMELQTTLNAKKGVPPCTNEDK